MARKTVDLRAAKEAKQKKIAIAGVALLVPLLAIQIPRTMRMLEGGQPVQAAAAPVAPAATAEEPASLAPPTLGASAPAPAEAAPAAPAAAAAEPPEGTLVSFELFKSKDPFAAQIRPGAAGSAGGAGTVSGAAERPAEGTTSGAEAPGGAAAALTSAEIEVNGTVETVGVDGEFPAAAPVFRLTAVKKGSVEIGIAGGSLATGDATVTIRKGESLTLVNTADGTRYVLRLRSVS